MYTELAAKGNNKNKIKIKIILYHFILCSIIVLMANQTDKTNKRQFITQPEYAVSCLMVILIPLTEHNLQMLNSYQ